MAAIRVRKDQKELVHVLYAVNGQLGISVDANMIVESVQKGCMAEGKVQVGDKILKIDNEPIVSPEQLTKLVQSRSGGMLKVHVWHDKEATRMRAQHSNPRNGYEIKDVMLVWNPRSGQKLGLSVKGDSTGVYVSKLDEQSVSIMYLTEGDRVLQIDGWPVSDREFCKALMVQAFKYTNRCCLKIERAIDDNTKSEVSRVLTACSNQDPSVLMQSDVMEIANRQRDKVIRHEVLDNNQVKHIYAAVPAPEKNSLEKKKDAGQMKKVVVDAQPNIQIIGMDQSILENPRQKRRTSGERLSAEK